MFSQSKLKGTFGRVYPIAMLIFYILIIIECVIRVILRDQNAIISIWPFYSVIIIGLFFFIMGILQWIRYRLWENFVLGLFFSTGTILTIIGHFIPGSIFFLLWLLNLLLLILFVVIKWTVLYGHEKFEANARRLFKLAASVITQTSDGFTERPFSAGRISSSREEISEFVRFLNGKYIARAFFIENNIYLAFSLNKSVLVATHPEEVSHIIINNEDVMSIIITEADYRQYRETYNFDQLCASVGDVFKQFLEYYKSGNESRIITELKTAR
jgi:hypothetical protein